MRQFKSDLVSIEERETLWKTRLGKLPELHCFDMYKYWQQWIKEEQEKKIKPFKAGQTVECEKLSRCWKILQQRYKNSGQPQNKQKLHDATVARCKIII